MHFTVFTKKLKSRRWRELYKKKKEKKKSERDVCDCVSMLARWERWEKLWEKDGGLCLHDEGREGGHSLQSTEQRFAPALRKTPAIRSPEAAVQRGGAACMQTTISCKLNWRPSESKLFSKKKKAQTYITVCWGLISKQTNEKQNNPSANDGSAEMMTQSCVCVESEQ